MSTKLPSNYEKDLTSLYNMFDMSLEEISKSYIHYKLGANTTEYKQDEETFKSIKVQISAIKDDLSADAEIVNNKLTKLNKEITKLNKENTKLSNKLNTFDNQGLAAEGELKSQQFIYNEIYAQNIILTIIILGNVGLYIIYNYKS